MQVTVLGATGKTGIEVVNQALDAGFEVIALVRDATKLQTRKNLRVVEGDATDEGSIIAASEGADVIISALGSNGGGLLEGANKAIINAAKKTGVKRIIELSSFAVQKEKLQGVAKFITGLAMGKMNADKSAGEAILRSSDLSWTIVYATLLNDQPKSGGVRVIPANEKIGLKHKITRADTAAWMLEEARNGSYVRKDVTISQ